MSNAVKFTHRGSICLEAHLAALAPPGGRHTIRVVVRDTGIGIPEDRIDRLFQPFTQADAATNRSYGGTGLGLAISRRLIEMLGGTIRVESRPGAGTTFEFTFTAGTADPARRAAAESRRADFSGMKILVAEDNLINQKVIARMLEKMGCAVALAGDGLSAIRALESASYDLVIMDLSMPEMDGMEAARRIRRMDGPRFSVPIVALTASASDEIRSQCLAAGMNDFLAKPVGLETVRRALERWRPPIPVALGALPLHASAAP
jgi:CheY-like chemotaxis protein/anti-sigma regulatory factor (Ser/Thr protein kinase)